MITPYTLKELLFLCAGIGSVLGIGRCPSLGIGIGIGRKKSYWNISNSCFHSCELSLAIMAWTFAL